MQIRVSNTKLAIKIFGSYTRGEEKEGSDIDVLVGFGEGASLFDFVGPGYYSEDIFGIPVDIVSERGLNPMMRDDVLKETGKGNWCRY